MGNGGYLYPSVFNIIVKIFLWETKRFVVGDVEISLEEEANGMFSMFKSLNFKMEGFYL